MKYKTADINGTVQIILCFRRDYLRFQKLF